eukprot:1035371-Rhodomonas_salina.1
MGRVGGEAVPIRGEYAAIVVALQNANPDQQLAILTDCLSAVMVLQRWRRRDFRPAVEDELHLDILQDILDEIRRSRSPTLFVWVKGHRGDPGNTAADKAADQGCEVDDEWMIYQRCTHPL